MHYSKSTKIQYGFSLVEISLVLIIFGIFSTIGINLLRTANADQKQKITAAYVNKAKVALLLYAKKNDRLPCPDTDGDGYENEATKCLEVGSLPYVTVGLEHLLPEKESDNRIEYGVYGGGDKLSLTDKMQIDDPENKVSPKNLFDERLINIGQAQASTDHPFVRKDSKGIEGCQSAVPEGIINPAFVVELKYDPSLKRPADRKNCFFTDPILYPAKLISVTAFELSSWRSK